MLRALKILTLVAVLTAIPARAWAIPTIDGFWTSANSDGYSLFLENYVDSANGNAASQGVIGVAIDVASNSLLVMFAQQISVNDNSYGTNAQGWAHTFANLEGSDNLHLVIKDTSAAVRFDGQIDYIDCVGAIPSTVKPCVSGGVTAGTDGSAAVGANRFELSASSLQWNIANNPCGSSGANANANSPATNGAGYTSNTSTTPGCQLANEDWLFTTIWELSFQLVGGNGNSLNLGTLDLATIRSLIDVVDVHNSPAKGADTDACNDPYFSGASISGCSAAAIPEPASLMLVGSGAVLLAAVLRRRNAA